jgi:hypothetical protein
MSLDNPFFSGQEWHFNEVGSSGDDDFRVDMIRDGAFDDMPHLAPRVIEASVRENDCPQCLSVAGKLCTDWTRSTITGEWRGSGYVREGAHAGRLAAMVSA